MAVSDLGALHCALLGLDVEVRKNLLQEPLGGSLRTVHEGRAGAQNQLGGGGNSRDLFLGCVGDFDGRRGPGTTVAYTYSYSAHLFV